MPRQADGLDAAMLAIEYSMYTNVSILRIDAHPIQAVKYNPASWRVPYDHVVWKDPKQILVIYCLQLLLVLLLYPIPEDGRGAPPKNYYRHYFGRLHRPQDFQFLVDGITRILNQPVSRPNELHYTLLRVQITDASDQLLSPRQPTLRKMGARNADALLGGFAVQQALSIIYD